MQQRIGPVLLHVTMEMEPSHEAEINKWYDEEHLPEIMAVPGFISARRFKRVEGPDVRKPHTYLAIYEMSNEQVVLDQSYLTFHTGWKGAPSLGTPGTRQASLHYKSQRSIRRQVYPVRGPYTDHSGQSKPPVPVVGSSMEDAWQQPIGGAILHLALTPDPQWEVEILEWHDQEQIPAWMACPGFLSVRRFMLRYDADRGDPSVVGNYQHLYVFQLQDESATRSKEYREAVGRLEASRKRIPGQAYANQGLYRQIYPVSGSYVHHEGAL